MCRLYLNFRSIITTFEEENIFKISFLSNTLKKKEEISYIKIEKLRSIFNF